MLKWRLSCVVVCDNLRQSLVHTLTELCLCLLRGDCIYREQICMFTVLNKKKKGLSHLWNLPSSGGSEDAQEKLGSDFSDSSCCSILLVTGGLWYRGMSLQPECYPPKIQGPWCFLSWDLSTHSYLWLSWARVQGVQNNYNDSKEVTMTMWLPGYLHLTKDT